MTFDYRLLVLDVDGTLIGESGLPSERVGSALRAVQDRGIHIALCSGRPMASCGAIARSLDLRGPHAVFNGALVKDPQSGEVVLKRPLDKAMAREVLAYCRRHDVCIELYTEDTHFVERDWYESRMHAISIRVTYDLGDLDDLLRSQEIVKAQIITSDERTRRLIRDLAREMDGVVGISWAIPMPPAVGMECVNVVDRTVSKGEAVKALIAHFGLSREQVVAAGDAPNDLPVFAEVGYRIVMGNADDALREQADFVAPHVDEDGLAVAVEQVLLQSRIAPPPLNTAKPAK